MEITNKTTDLCRERRPREYAYLRKYGNCHNDKMTKVVHKEEVQHKPREGASEERRCEESAGNRPNSFTVIEKMIRLPRPKPKRRPASRRLPGQLKGTDPQRRSGEKSAKM